MPFKYALMCDTLPWIGYNILETPREILQAAADVGYDSIDLPADLTMNAQRWRQMVEESGLVVTEVLAAWGYYHAGEERNLASPDGETRQRAVQYALDTVDLAAALGPDSPNFVPPNPPCPSSPIRANPSPCCGATFAIRSGKFAPMPASAASPSCWNL